MVVASPLNLSAQFIGEQRVIFRALNWSAYQQILQAVGDRRFTRLSYDLGT